MATMELNNGRLAMIGAFSSRGGAVECAPAPPAPLGIAGMVAQELVTGAKIF
jgi:hypothetical protein